MFQQLSIAGLTQPEFQQRAPAVASASFLAEISVRSPQKLFIFIILKKYILDQSTGKIFNLILEKYALAVAQN